MTTSLLLADLGGTHVRVRAVGPQGETLNELQEVGSGTGDGSAQAAMEELRDVVHRSVVARQIVPGGMELVIASRGFRAEQGERRTVREIAALVQATKVTLVPDGVAAYVGCLGAQPGVVVTVGTGTVALAVDHSSQVHKLDGLGPQLGDAGSGYQVGLDGLKSACRYADGRRGGSHMLRDAALQVFGTVEGLPDVIQPIDQLRNISRFAEAVVTAARLGDEAAGHILDKAARDVAELAIDAAALVSRETELPIVIGGGFVAAVPELVDRLQRWFGENSRYTPSIGPGLSTLDGCYEIGMHGTPAVFRSWTEELSGQWLRS